MAPTKKFTSSGLDWGYLYSSDKKNSCRRSAGPSLKYYVISGHTDGIQATNRENSKLIRKTLISK